jgi:hypothetical protein
MELEAPTYMEGPILWMADAWKGRREPMVWMDRHYGVADTFGRPTRVYSNWMSDEDSGLGCWEGMGHKHEHWVVLEYRIL